MTELSHLPIASSETIAFIYIYTFITSLYYRFIFCDNGQFYSDTVDSDGNTGYKLEFKDSTLYMYVWDYTRFKAISSASDENDSARYYSPGQPTENSLRSIKNNVICFKRKQIKQYVWNRNSINIGSLIRSTRQQW